MDPAPLRERSDRSKNPSERCSASLKQVTKGFDSSSLGSISFVLMKRLREGEYAAILSPKPMQCTQNPSSIKIFLVFSLCKTIAGAKYIIPSSPSVFFTYVRCLHFGHMPIVS